MAAKTVVGVDVGASGIKGAIVDVKTGELLTERLRLDTPKPATPEAMAKTFAELIKMLKWDGPVGCGFPAIIKDGVAFSAANIDESWIGTSVAEVFGEAIGQPVYVLNDADAAGLAEIKFGRGKDVDGVVLVVTVGSGLGSGLFVDGELVPNTELGHLYLKGHEDVVETYASSAAKKRENLDYDVWGLRLDEFLDHIERILSPNLIILGGGISRKFDKYQSKLTLNAEIAAAEFENKAGALGAAMYAVGQMAKY